ncbi:hypothetical protein L7F22_010860 [Adiantum nelumboides]|nr:hypothetical protein [Adiantum nelumboides]
MKSRFCLHRQSNHIFLVIITYILAEYVRFVQSKGHVGIIKLQHVYADLVASSRKKSGNGMSKEHVELFKAHDRARHGRKLANMVLVPYDPHTSSTSSTIACKDMICDHAFKVSNSGFDSSQACSYSFQYGDGSSTTGYLVADTLIYSTVQPNNTLANSEAKIVFGPHYNVNLRGISVGGNPLIADSSTYETTDLQGTIFDSGTTLAYLMEPLYTSFINTIIKEAPIGARLVSEQGTPCFIYTGSVDEAFPLVTLHFEGADMTLTARHYLIKQADVNVQLWCIGWHPISAGTTVTGGLLTILGDIVLKDQLVLYDLENQRIGWVNHDSLSSQPILLTLESPPSGLSAHSRVSPTFNYSRTRQESRHRAPQGSSSLPDSFLKT